MIPTIIVEFHSEVLGNGEFWRGPANKVAEIRNVVARELAQYVSLDGKARTVGMWTVRSKP